MGRLVAGCVILLLSSTSVLAQGFNGYKEQGERWCQSNPYDLPPSGGTLHPVCKTAEELDELPHVIKLVIPEVAIGGPEHELGWLVVVNSSAKPSQFAALIVYRDGSSLRVMSGDLDGSSPNGLTPEINPLSSVSITLHNPSKPGARAMSAIIWCERECATQAVARPALDMFSKESVFPSQRVR